MGHGIGCICPQSYNNNGSNDELLRRPVTGNCLPRDGWCLMCELNLLASERFHPKLASDVWLSLQMPARTGNSVSLCTLMTTLSRLFEYKSDEQSTQRLYKIEHTHHKIFTEMLIDLYVTIKSKTTYEI